MANAKQEVVVIKCDKKNPLHVNFLKKIRALNGYAQASTFADAVIQYFMNLESSLEELNVAFATCRHKKEPCRQVHANLQKRNLI